MDLGQGSSDDDEDAGGSSDDDEPGSDEDAGGDAILDDMAAGLSQRDYERLLAAGGASPSGSDSQGSEQGEEEGEEQGGEEGALDGSGASEEEQRAGRQAAPRRRQRALAAVEDDFLRLDELDAFLEAAERAEQGEGPCGLGGLEGWALVRVGQGSVCLGLRGRQCGGAGCIHPGIGGLVCRLVCGPRPGRRRASVHI